MSNLPALPDPRSAAVPVLIEQCRAIHARQDELIGGLDLETADEWRRRASAIEKYLAGRKGQDDARRAARVLDAAVGWALKDDVEPGERTDLAPAQVMAGSVPHTERYNLRELSRYRSVWRYDNDLKGLSRNACLSLIKAAKARATEGMTDVRAGRFQDVLADIEPGTVDLILTDPPYAEDALASYRDLGEFAARVLRPGGSLVSYVGQSTLPGALAAFSEHLRYWWTFALTHEHGGQQIPGKWVIAEWKPLVWFVRGHREGRDYIGDRLRGTAPRKDLHEWAQGTAEVAYLIHRLTEPEGLVIDPFAGSGSFGEVAVELGRRFIGADLTLGDSVGRTA